MSAENLPKANCETKVINLPGLFIGSTLQIQVVGLGTSMTKLIGMESGNFILIRIPPLAEIWSKRYEKNQCIIRYIFSGWVYAFRCTLLGLIKEPCRMALLSYPEALENINLRKHERINCQIASEVIIKEQLYKGVVIDKPKDEEIDIKSEENLAEYIMELQGQKSEYTMLIEW